MTVVQTDTACIWPDPCAKLDIQQLAAAFVFHLQEWNEALLANDDYWDQNAFNDLMNKGAKFDDQRSDRLFM